MPTTDTRKAKHVVTLDSWQAYVDLASAENPHTDAGRASRTGSASFTDSASFDAFATTAQRGGWSTPHDKALTEAIIDRVSSMVSIPTYAVTDDPAHAETYDVGALLSGSGDYWIEPIHSHFDQQPGHVVAITASITAGGATKKSTMIRRGAVTLALAEAMELAGIPVEIWITDTRSSSGPNGAPIVEWRVNAKPAGLPIDHERVLIALAHPSTLRRFGFAACERHDAPEVRRLSTRGQGYPAAPTLKGDLVVPALTYREPNPFENDADAIRWAIKQLETYGILDNSAAA